MIYGAALTNFIILLMHIFGGGPSTAKPLLAANDLKPVPKYTNYYCWHLVTLTLLAMSLGFAWYAIDPQAREAAILVTGLSVAFMVWGFVLVVWKKQRHIDMPQWILFLVSTIVSIAALW